MKQIPVERIRELTAKLNQWRYEYYNLNAPTVSDTVYDRHYDELERLERESGVHRLTPLLKRSATL